MSESKILCIDDTPEEVIGKNRNATLEKILKDIYKSTPYKVIFKTDGKKGVETARDESIKLVLLDIVFNGQRNQGDVIAKELQTVRPELKVIVLTRLDEKGRKISFGHKPNIVHYVVKRELPLIQERLKNLSCAIIEDYENKGWHLEYDGRETIILSKGKESYGINIPITAKQAIMDCIPLPNRPVNVNLPSDQLNKAHNMINKNVLEKTDWHTWGILTREGCAKGQLKLSIGKVVPFLTSGATPKDHYVTQSQFEKFKKEMESLKKDVLAKLEEISKTKGGL